jgi:nucleotide-binding universal stress UspA family protein
MKAIIVATDFSAAAEKAMLYAGQLAQNINASVLLLHVYQVPVGMNDMPVLMVSTEELKRNADSGLTRAKELLQKNFGSVAVKTESRLGDTVEELRDLCKKTDPVLIVAGKHGTSGIEEIMFGSTSLSIIRHTAHPVIVVPDRSTLNEPRNAVLAVDASVEKLSIEKIKVLANLLKIRLHVIHVKSEKTATLNLGDVLTELSADYTTIYDHEFVHGVESYINGNNIDLLIILPHKHNLVERLFFKTHTKELLNKIAIPIMCIGEN